MGLDIDRDQFTDRDFQLFRERVRLDLEALATLLSRPGFGQGPTSIGAELELHLVDRSMRPAPLNMAVQETAQDPRVTLELNRFNLELNAMPTLLAGQPFARMRAEFEDGLGGLRRAAATHDCQLAMMGILPTLKEENLTASSRTPMLRYQALSTQLRELRGEAFEVRVNGLDPLILRCDDVTLEGANTSWQLHLRVEPADFAAHYNAAQLATAPVLAASGNSPLFVGHRLWEETRIALFKQSVDPRTDFSGDWHRPPRVGLGSGWVRHGALELFRESVALYEPLLPVCGDEDPLACVAAGKSPRLEQLRLHHGTVWGWNRAVYDPVDGDDSAHLRIELRAMAAGPTLTDMLANSAFALGLTLGLAQDAEQWLPQIPFIYARRNLYRSAEQGLGAELLWPCDGTPSPTLRSARDVVLSLLPVAQRGLESAGVDHADFGPLLQVIEERTQSGQTGAVWQRQRLAQLHTQMGADAALAWLLEDYLALSESDRPVHTWQRGDAT